MALAQVHVGQIVRRPGFLRPGSRRWAPAAGKVTPAPASPYREATGFEQFRRKVLVGRPFAYRAAMDRPFPDPGLQVPEATVRMLPALHPWGRYTVPHPGRRARIQAAYPTLAQGFPNRPTLSEPTGYYTAAGEARGLGDPALGGFFKSLVKKVGRVVQKVIPKEVLKVATYVAAPLVAPIAATGILGERAKETGREVISVIGKGLQIAGPALSFIPGIGVPLAAGASAIGQVATSWGTTGKPFSFLHKPLGPLAQVAGSAAIGPSVTGAWNMFSGFFGTPTGNVASAGDLQRLAIEAEYGAVPPPAPSIGWGDVAQNVAKVGTAVLPIASQLLQRYLPADTVAPTPEVLYAGGGGPPVDPSVPYVAGSVGAPGAPWEAPPAMAPEMVQAGIFGGGWTMPLLFAGGGLLLLFARR